MPLILAETTAALLERMADGLAAGRDPWARHWLVLPGSGRSEWLQRSWARRAGIAAHSQIVPLRSLIEQAASPASGPFSQERLVLAVAQALPAVAGRMPLPAGCDCTVVDARVLAWSQQVADAIDLGLLCRENRERWGDSPFLGAVTGHPAVAAALAGHLGMLMPDAFRAAVARWVEHWRQRGGVPRLWIQLDAGLPQVLLRCLGDLLELLPPDQAHLSLLCPSHGFWGDLRTRRRWRDGEDAGPVLTSLGRQAQDLHNQAIDRFLAQGGGGEELVAADPPDSLLGRLQECCRAAAAPAATRPLADDDTSFTVHACRSPLRELEVCRDRILQAMAEDATLTADDILLLLADPEQQGALVGAGLQPLPVRVLGLGGAVASPVATGFLRLLKALGGRLGLADLQGLIEEPLIAERFGFTGKGPELVAWLEQARFRWGVDAGQRADLQGAGETRWNLAFALRRLGLGAVVAGSQRDGLVDDDAAPLERASGLSTALLARLADFATALHEARQEWLGLGVPEMAGSPQALPTARPLSAWCALLGAWCARFLGDGDAAVGEQRTQLVNTILPALAGAAPDGLRFHSDAVLRLLTERLEALGTSQGSGQGGITVADLRHYAGTPARMVVVAGLGAERFPRHEERPAWHPLARSRALGDPDRRDADRHALLLALLGCDERLVLTYQGGSDEDGKERPPSTPLADLLAAVDAVCDGPAIARVLVRHGLNGFSPQACAAGGRAVARSFLASDHRGARALAEPHRAPYPGLWSELLPAAGPPRPLGFHDLTDLFQEPCRILVRRLGLRLPEEAEEPDQEDVLALDGLARWSLRDGLLQARLTGGDEEALRRRAAAAGELPRGRYGDAVWEKIGKELPAIRGPLTPIARNAELSAGGRMITVAFPAGWYRDGAGGAVFCSPSSRSTKNELAMGIGLVCLALAEDTGAVATWFQAENQPTILQAPDRARATDLLADLCRLHQLAELLPLPFWPQAHGRMRQLIERQQDGVPLPPERILMAGWSQWAEGDGHADAGPSESLKPATRTCFRGLDDPFTWTPAVPADWLPDDGRPLAWRLFRFVCRWQDAVGGAQP